MAVQPKQYTADEFEAFIARPENRARLFELVNGEIVEKMPTEEHGIIVLRIGARLLLFVEERKAGWVSTEARHHLPHDPHNARLPDISFRASAGGDVVRRGSVMQMPDLAVEVKSPDDSYKDMRDKADYYLRNGTRMVWLVYPEKRIVEVYTPDEQQILTSGDTLSGGALLPGFMLALEDIFPA